MDARPALSAPSATAATLGAAAAGAWLAWLVSLPLYAMTGPALVVSLLGASGWRCTVVAPLRDTAFLLIGIGIGAGIDERVTDAVLRWPLAFAVLALLLVTILATCRWLLMHGFGFGPRSAVLAASPGHLSFILGLSTEAGADIGRVAVVQSVRLLLLTLCVPALAPVLGITLGPGMLPPAPAMPVVATAGLLGLSWLLSRPLRRWRVPAATFLAGAALSAAGQATGLVAGTLDPWLAVPCFVVIGALVGTQFSGITGAEIRHGLMAGIAVTTVALVLTLAAALPVAAILGEPVLDVTVAFAPGGLETMLAMGLALGASPGLVAACHMARLLLLPFILPLFLRGGDRDGDPRPNASPPPGH